MPTTAWRFTGTELATARWSGSRELNAKDLINLMDITVLRWPEYAAQPTTLQSTRTSRAARSPSWSAGCSTPVIDGAMIESVKGDLRPGTSAVVVLSSDAEVDAIVHAFEGQPMELVASDLSRPGPGPAATGRATGHAAPAGPAGPAAAVTPYA